MNAGSSWAVRVGPEALLLFAVLFGPLAFGATEPWSLAVLEVAIFLMLFLVALGPAPDLRQPVYKTLIPAVLGVIILAVCQRLNPASISAPASPFPFTFSAEGTSRALVLWGAYAALLWCAPRILSDHRAAVRFAWTLFLLGAFIAFVGILQRGQGNTAYYGLRKIRHGDPFGPYTNYNHAASMLAMSALVGAGLLFSRFADFRKKVNAERIYDFAAAQAVSIFLLILIVAGVVTTQSRGGRHALFAAAWVVGLGAIAWRDKKKTALTAVAVLGASAAAYGFTVWANPHLIGWGFKKPVTSMLYRFSMYSGGAQLAQDFPVFGVGLGALMGAFPQYQEKIVVGIVDHLHSDWLELLVETGITGFSFIFLGLSLFAWKVVRAWLGLEAPLRLLAGGGLAAALSFVAHNLIEFSFQIPANAVLFLAVVVWFGAIVAQRSGMPAKAPEPAPRTLRYALCVAALVLAVLAVRPVMASALAARAGAASVVGEKK